MTWPKAEIAAAGRERRAAGQRQPPVPCLARCHQDLLRCCQQPFAGFLAGCSMVSLFDGSWGDVMHKVVLAALVAGSALAPLPALADAREDVVNGMTRCAGLTDDHQWLDCYYGA